MRYLTLLACLPACIPYYGPSLDLAAAPAFPATTPRVSYGYADCVAPGEATDDFQLVYDTDIDTDRPLFEYTAVCRSDCNPGLITIF